MLKNWTKIIKKNKVDFLVYRPAGGGTIEMFDIAVMSERGKGIGTSLINEMIKREKPKVIHGITRESNEGAITFYKKLGFTTTLLENFYPDGNAVMVIKQCE